MTNLGLELPEPPKPAGAYIPSAKAGNLVFVAGQIPFIDGQLRFQGKIGRDLNVEDGYQAARTCTLNALSVLKAEVGSLERVRRIVRVAGYVNCSEDFHDQAKILNGASDLLKEVFGDDGKHARIAIGTNSLPLNASVEVEIIAEVTG